MIFSTNSLINFQTNQKAIKKPFFCFGAKYSQNQSFEKKDYLQKSQKLDFQRFSRQNEANSEYSYSKIKK